MAHPLRWHCTLLGLLASVSLAGCYEAERIEHYTVNKPPPIETVQKDQPSPDEPPGEPTDRTLAVIVPHGEQAWFFKLTGPKNPVAAKRGAFQSFVESVHFSAEGKPEWPLPEGWQERSGNDIRYATLVIPGEGEPLELSVTALPKPPGDDENYALVNVNRWRNQLKLPPIAREQLAAESTTLEVDGAQATMVDLVGTATPGAMGRPPFFPGAGNGK